MPDLPTVPAIPECEAPSPSRSEPKAARWPFYLAISAFTALWADLIHQLSYIWSTDEQYAYGWFVPILAAGLFLRKWPTRPRVEVPSAFGALFPWSFGPSARRKHLPTLLIAGIMILLIPIRVIHEINQDWPLFSWTLTLGIVGISLYAVYLRGGWRPVKYFAFPICFILVAVKWPYRIEHTLTQTMMRVVASISVEALGWFDIPALQHGNLIELDLGLVGVDEACSGIRSLQSTVMAALFLGELYLFRMPFRFLLLGIGVFLAFLLNVGRAIFLAWHAAAAGPGAVDKWHDFAGFTIVLVCFACLWLVALLLKWGGDQGTQGPRDQRTADLRPLSSDRCPSGPNVPASFSYALAIWTALLLLNNEGWYRAHAMHQAERVRWWVNLPTNSPTFKEVPVSQFALKLLKFDQGSTGAWVESDGTQWSVYCFRWRAGDPTARMSALGHRPEYCMTGSGHELHAALGVKRVEVNGLEFPFRTYVFDSSERPLYVFFCLWEDGAETQAGFGGTKYGDRLRAVLAGRRGMGQQTLELICSGYPDMETTELMVRKQLPELIRLERVEPAQKGSVE